MSQDGQSRKGKKVVCPRFVWIWAIWRKLMERTTVKVSGGTYSFESFHLGEVLKGLKLCLIQLNCLQVFELLEEGCVFWGDFLDFCRVQRQLRDWVKEVGLESRIVSTHSGRFGVQASVCGLIDWWERRDIFSSVLIGQWTLKLVSLTCSSSLTSSSWSLFKISSLMVGMDTFVSVVACSGVVC